MKILMKIINVILYPEVASFLATVCFDAVYHFKGINFLMTYLIIATYIRVSRIGQ